MKTLKQIREQSVRLREDIVKASNLRVAVKIKDKLFWASQPEDKRWSHYGLYLNKVPPAARRQVERETTKAEYGFYDMSTKKFYGFDTTAGGPNSSEELPYRGGIQKQDYNITNV